MDRLTIEQRRKNMQAIKGSGTSIENILAKELWALGYRYRKNNPKVYGRPDLTIKRLKLAIFVDGEFWHGKDWERRKHDIKTNVKFWRDKIQRNILRDAEVTQYLQNSGWTVLRFWGKEVKKNLPACIEQIVNKLHELKKNENC